MIPRKYIVTTTRGSAESSRIWESGKPLALGHPLRFVLEPAGDGIRVRDLGTELDRVVGDRIRMLPGGSGEIELGGARIRIRPARALESVVAASRGQRLRAYRMAGNWVLESFDLEARLVAGPKSAPWFAVEKHAQGYRVSALTSEVRLGDEIIAKSSQRDLDARALASLKLAVNAEGGQSQHWSFGLADAPILADRPPIIDPYAGAEARFFRQALKSAGIALTSFILLALIWPKPKEDPKELIPPQFAKIVMSQATKTRAQASADQGAPSANKHPTRAQDAAVVQAFRAKALNNAVSGLLKGGMTRLLAQSDFVAGSAKSADARRILDAKSENLRATNPLGEAGRAPAAVRIAALGGEGNGPGGSAVGYGKGSHAGLKGQGKGFVPFVSADLNGSTVDEGLTKDEVGEVIHRHLSEVRYCYESAMVRQPDLEGKLLTGFVINGGGVVRSAEAKTSTLPDPRLDDCILRRLVTWQFPHPRGGVDVAVAYPFIFKTLGR